MGILRPPEKAFLFIGTLFSAENIFDDALNVLKKKFGDILFKSHPVSWNFTDHYTEELGSPVYRSFIFFNTIIDPASLVEAKLTTNEIEKTFSCDKKRQINIDPGYLTLAKVVLASTKNYSHRLSLGKGIYGELELFYKDKTFVPHLFTYSDYMEKNCIEMFIKARGMLKQIVNSE